MDNSNNDFHPKKIVICTVGYDLHYRQFVCYKLNRFLNWIGFPSRVFKENNKNGSLKGLFGLEGLKHFLVNENGKIGIFDGTHFTIDERKRISNEISDKLKGIDYKIVWIESKIEKIPICNFLNEFEQEKLDNPNFDFTKKNEELKGLCYRCLFHPLNDNDSSYVKIHDFQTVTCNRMEGEIESKIVYFLSNLKLNRNPIFLTRHGESEYNLLKKVGGDCPLTQMGRKYALKIFKFMKTLPSDDTKRLKAFVSVLKRTTETAELAGLKKEGVEVIKCETLKEIYAGLCEEMSYTEIEQNFPDVFLKRNKDKLNYRYPEGESYQDLITRLEPIILEVERSQTPVIIVAHRAVLRVIQGYFLCIPKEEIPISEMPIHSLVKLDPFASGFYKTSFKFDVESDLVAKDEKFYIGNPF